MFTPISIYGNFIPYRCIPYERIDCTSQTTTSNTNARAPYAIPTYSPGFQSRYAVEVARRRSRRQYHPKQTYTFTDSTPTIPTLTPEQLAQARLLGPEFSFVRSDDSFKPEPYVPAHTLRAREKWHPYQPTSQQGHSPSWAGKGSAKEARDVQGNSETSHHGVRVFGLESVGANKDGDAEDLERAETASEIEVEEMLDA
ncbi:uncharacterized protein STEHIDRAFT_162027 [Stereum hirsutum FP-91666 SS1]|uniref:uncharacterized protein n=1 Tax=Stereum hirsutum (strain FP-91666) TaxID=721885 RepID=UPI000444A46B|nr:uncharacterized protein STEHIDRAFT_162027 [Stereum hirsutum FP-91666 SS1]EIM81020.1 hypothetical protein STEHIDRAFT_162027 [Stereum hirsutum FP-91666 SS1]